MEGSAQSQLLVATGQRAGVARGRNRVPGGRVWKLEAIDASCNAGRAASRPAASDQFIFCGN